MINLAKTQTVSDVCRSCDFVSANCIVNVRFVDGRTNTYRFDEANSCHVVERMKISVVSNVVVLDLYNY